MPWDKNAEVGRLVDDPNMELTDGWGTARCRVQIVRAGGRTVVLLTQQSNASDGCSLVNGAERFADALRDRYFPDGSGRPDFVLRLVGGGASEAWDDDSSSAHQLLTTFSPDGSADWGTVDAVDLALLKQHAGAGRGAGYVAPVEPKLWSSRWVLLPVARLPEPQRLFRAQCMEDGLTRTTNRLLQPAGLRVCRCRYHAGSWRRASRLACDALRRAHELIPDHDDVGAIGVEAAQQLRLRSADIGVHDEARSLVLDAIELSSDLQDYINGQHRSQAIRDQRVAAVPITVYFDVDAEPPGPSFGRLQDASVKRR